MKKIIVSENGFNDIIKRSIIEESYNDKVILAKKELDNSFGKGSYSDKNTGDIVGVFIKKSNGIPTEKSLWKSDVLDYLEDKFNKLITDKDERSGFLSQVLQDWWDGYKGLSDGVLSKYSFLNKRM